MTPTSDTGEGEAGRAWIVDADLKDFFGSVDHEKLFALVAQRVSDGRVLRLIEAMLTAGSYGEGRLFPSERGTPQGGVASPLLSNILLTPFDREMRSRGYQLTRYADDWVIEHRDEIAAVAVGTPVTGRPPRRSVQAAFPHTACMGLSLSRVHHATFVVLCCFILCSTRAASPSRPHITVAVAHRTALLQRRRRLVLHQREHGGRLPVIGWFTTR